MSEIHFSTISALLPVTAHAVGSQTVQTIEARHLYEFLQIKKDFSAWIKAQIKRGKFVEGRDYTTFTPEGERQNQGFIRIEYHISFDMGKHIAMMSNADKGHEVRAYFLDCERVAHGQPSLPQVVNPANRALIDTIVRLDVVEQEAAAAREAAYAAEQRAVRAETMAGLALEDAHRMTIETCIVRNGLLRQFPPATWPEAARWLRRFCDDYGLRMEKTPTPGKLWADEWSYPIRALAAWLEYEQRKPRQISLVSPDRDGNSFTQDPAAPYVPRRRSTVRV